MTDEQVARICLCLRCIFIILCVIAGFIFVGNVTGQPSPVLRYDTYLRAYIGPSEPAGIRIFVGTTSSTSPNADIGPPFDQVGENPDIGYWSKSIRVIAPDDPCLIEPALVLDCRDTGWVDIPTPDVKIEQPPNSGQWVHDKDMRVVIHTASMELGYCPSTSCGAKLLLPRTKLSSILPSLKRRSVGK